MLNLAESEGNTNVVLRKFAYLLVGTNPGSLIQGANNRRGKFPLIIS